ncbi:MAG: TolC family protein [Melioribacteraceae bacterium]|nr:TolC family protein [Melioribacteraceae bacterium]MCF8262927.1 TolC family protein [Melioribacteraceae bacterium]MCF8431092.1 TolC family protein [Melioribacteraceae bacterium]
MRRIIIILAMIPFLMIAQEQSKFTLKSSLETGLANSKNIKIRQAAVRESEAKISEIGSQMYPKLSFTAGYVRFSDVPPFQLSLPIFPNPVTIQETVLNNYQLKLSITQPLFTGFNLSSVKSASEFNSSALDAELQKEMNDEKFRIMNSFWNFAKAQNNLELIEKRKEVFNSILNDAENFYANGMFTKNDLLKVQVQASNIELLKIEVANGVETARVFFNKVIGINLSTATKINPNIVAEISFNYSYNELLEKAFANRKELEAQESRINSSKEFVTASQSGYYPQIFLFGNVYYNSPNQRYLPVQDEFNESWDVGVSLNWSLWDWGGTKSKVEQNEQKLVQLQTMKSLLMEGIEAEVYAAYLNAKKNFDKIEIMELNLKQSEENFRITQQQFKNQIATGTDLIDAETAKYESEINLINAKIDFRIAEAALLKSAGINLSEEL